MRAWPVHCDRRCPRTAAAIDRHRVGRKRDLSVRVVLVLHQFRLDGAIGLGFPREDLPASLALC